MTRVTVEDIEREYSAGPNDWEQIVGYITDMFRHDRMNTVHLDVDIAMILIECRKAALDMQARERRLVDEAFEGYLAELLHVGYRHAIDGPEAMPIHRLISRMNSDEWGRYVGYVSHYLKEYLTTTTDKEATDA
jgi:3-methyladenine DNA glycosylase/8-oxoguanine DNA glycosylase